MQILNVHERVIARPAEEVGAVLQTLASPQDRLWPKEKWPPMRLDGPLQRGSRGGHGPIRYRVANCAPGKEVVFEFLAPQGFDGCHFFEVIGVDQRSSMIRHTIDMKIGGRALLSWPLLFRPLHDALLEDVFDKVENGLCASAKNRKWSGWVRLLRGLLRRKAAKARTDTGG